MSPGRSPTEISVGKLKGNDWTYSLNIFPDSTIGSSTLLMCNSNPAISDGPVKENVGEIVFNT